MRAIYSLQLCDGFGPIGRVSELQERGTSTQCYKRFTTVNSVDNVIKRFYGRKSRQQSHLNMHVSFTPLLAAYGVRHRA